jgi:hypothetical protein
MGSKAQADVPVVQSNATRVFIVIKAAIVQHAKEPLSMKVLLAFLPIRLARHVFEQICESGRSCEFLCVAALEDREILRLATNTISSNSWQDFESPDVYETHSPSPTRKSRNLARSNRNRLSQSSEEDSDEDSDVDSDEANRLGRKGTKKVGGQEGLLAESNSDIISTALNPEEAAKRFRAATGVDGRNVGEYECLAVHNS